MNDDISISNYKKVITGNDIIKKRNDILAKKILSGLSKRGMSGYYCQTSEEAINLVLSLIPSGNSVSWGGSMTIRDMGLPAALKNGNFQVHDRDDAKSMDEMMEIQRQALLMDCYITSTNAISDDGILVNVDGKGNRVAAISFGPKEVIVIAGINKVAYSEEAAIERARKVAAPTNIQRFPGVKTPCYETGICMNCTSPDCICSQILITRVSRPIGRIKVILVNENLGF